MTVPSFCDKLNNYYSTVGGEPLPLPSKAGLQSAQELEHLSIGEIKHLMNKLDVGKSTSTEDFPTWVSVEGKEDICLPLHNIINSMLDTSEFPNMWKRAQIRPIPKIACPSKYKDYRPISILFHLGKLSEEVIINKMRSKLEAEIDPAQFAYQPNIGSVDALIKLFDDFTSELDNPNVKFIQSAAMDFSKAFDRLQPAILIEKMKRYNFNPRIISLISNFLDMRMQCVRYGDRQSSYICSSVGAPQGTKLGPVLWLIYSNDLSAEGFNHIKYADDTTFYTSVTSYDNTSAVSPAVISTQRWAADNSMQLNPEKTEVMNSSLSHKHHYKQDVVVDDLSFSPNSFTKFLGVFIDNKLFFNKHVDSLVSACSSRLFLMRKLKTIGLNSDGLKAFYLSNIRSKLSYAAPAW